MTLLASWAGFDDKPSGKQVASLYIGSDSRFSWNGKNPYDEGQKVFVSTRFPEIFGYCGDVFMSLNVVAPLVGMIDSNCLFSESDTIESKQSKIYKFISDAVSKLPVSNRFSFSILHGTRVGSNFALSHFNYSSQTDLIEHQNITLGSCSSKIFSGGSGKLDFDDRWIMMDSEKNEGKNTSRNVYHCLCRSIDNNSDSQTGGVPQAVCLYRIGNGRVLGVIHNDRLSIYGRTVDSIPEHDNIEWRNDSFERVDYTTMKRFVDAQPHYFRKK